MAEDPGERTDELKHLVWFGLGSREGSCRPYGRLEGMSGGHHAERHLPSIAWASIDARPRS